MNDLLYTPNTIRTFTGKMVNVFEPNPEMICIEDIAHALSNLCRFGGHTSSFYSVAQHSVSVYSIVDVKLKKAALLHDAAEAYLIDLPRPIKNEFTRYAELEHNMMLAISKTLDFDYPFHNDIINADNQVLEEEWRSIMIDKNGINCWNPEMAKYKFMECYRVIRMFKH